jgi:hypothetical protein
VSIDVFPLDAGLLASSQYSEGPATGHLDKGFSWFPRVFKQMLRWFPTLQVAITSKVNTSVKQQQKSFVSQVFV